MSNESLIRAMASRDDEFYTSRDDVERALGALAGQLRGLRVLADFDDPARSAFVSVMLGHFDEWGLAGLVATAPGAMRLEKAPGHMTIAPCGDVWDSPQGLSDIDACSLVATNPAFSEVSRWLPHVLGAGCDVIAICPLSALVYEHVWPHVASGGLRVLPWVPGTFGRPDGSRERLGTTRWVTTLDAPAPAPLVPAATGSGHLARYLNVDAWDVPRLQDLPGDVPGTFGVPLSYLDHPAPDLFDLVAEPDVGPVSEAWLSLYRAQGGRGHYSAGMRTPVLVRDGRAVVPYKRVFIRRRNQHVGG